MRHVARATSEIANAKKLHPDPFELDQLLWLVTHDDCLGEERAEEIWLSRRAHLLANLPRDSTSMINALGHFNDTANKSWLDAVPLGRGDWMSARVLGSRARIDQPAALRQMGERSEDYVWGAANWWIDELAAGDADGLSRAIMENARKGDNPLTDVVLCYENAPELIDASTLVHWQRRSHRARCHRPGEHPRRLQRLPELLVRKIQNKGGRNRRIERVFAG